MLNFSELVSDRPLNKLLQLDPAEPKGFSARAVANMMSGSSRSLSLTPEQFVEYLDSLGTDPNKAIALGVTDFPEAKITLKYSEDLTTTPPTISRTKDFFKFCNSDSVGLMLLDIDQSSTEAEVLAFISNISEVLSPAILGGDKLMSFRRPSSSAGVIDKTTGQPLKQSWHVFVPVRNPTAEVLELLFWYVWDKWPVPFISKTGVPFPRTIIDAAVRDPERLVFEADVTVAEGAKSLFEIAKRSTAYMPGGVLDSEQAIQILKPLAKTAAEAWPPLKQAILQSPEAMQIARDYQENLRNTPAYAGMSKTKFDQVMAARRGQNILSSDFLTTNDDKLIPVIDVLMNPESYMQPQQPGVNYRMSEPMRDFEEPDYGTSKARLLFFSDSPFNIILKSMAHGGSIHRLKFDAEALIAWAEEAPEDSLGDNFAAMINAAEMSNVQQSKLLKIIAKRVGSSVADLKKDITEAKQQEIPSTAEPESTQAPRVDKEATQHQIALAFLASLGPKDSYRLFGKKIYLFDKSIWKALSEAEMLSKIATDYAYCGGCKMVHHYTAIQSHILKITASNQGVESWPAAMGFPCADGFYAVKENLESGVKATIVKEPYKKEHYARFRLKFSPDPDCKTPGYSKLLKCVKNPRTLNQMLGLALCGYLNKIQEVGVLFGTGGTGKGTISRILSAMLPSNRITNLDLDQLSIDEKLFDLADSALNIISEVENTSAVLKRKPVNTVGLKRVTGGDLVKGRQLHKDHFKFYNPAAIIMAFNTWPMLDSTKDDLARRLENFITEFHKPEDFEKDVMLLDRIKEFELPGILHLWIEAAKDYLQNGPDNEHSKKLFKAWCASFDTVSLFASEVLEVDAVKGKPVSKKVLYGHYTRFCDPRNFTPQSYAQFNEAIAEIPGVQTGRNRATAVFKNIVVNTGNI